ncbi:uncharacterized protein LOC106180416 [Lingula anatina]|uniref:Uncharacterized protein LOC106180416 n=1 Tax=Lingula anatina TaxID=7574 RepID=A0A1S3KC67_LINAN|nr:uncharacterized protein LOC106180416 [Lingula anatina]|eukprot:XP_013419851.1 uncharacterized protein LOC106180416 [Lingula anatina]
MTRQTGVAVLLIIALTTVTSVTGAGPIPLTPEEEAQRDAAAADMATLPIEHQMLPGLPPGPIPPIPACECHAHGDVRYVTCDGRAFRFNTPPGDVGIMAKSIGGWLWYIITEQEFFDDGPKTRLTKVKYQIFSHYVIIEYKDTPDPNGLYTITVENDIIPGPPLFVDAVSLGPAGAPGVLFVGGGFNISVIDVDGDLYIEVSCTLLPPVLFDIRIRVARHCLQIHIPPIWQSWMEGICGDWNGFPANDVVALAGFPQVLPAPVMGFPFQQTTTMPI